MRTDLSLEDNLLYIFDSMTEMVEFTDSKFFSSRSGEWVGEEFQSWEDVETRCKKNWDYGTDVVDSFVDRLYKEEVIVTKHLKSKKRKSSYNDEGEGEMEWERMMNGEAFWRETKKESTEGPGEMTIIVDTSTSYDKESEDILWRGGAALALVKILEERSYKVELWATNGSQLFSGSTNSVITACCLKRASDPLDMTTLTNTLAGWFYRSSTFALLDTICEHAHRTARSGYGNVCPPNQVDLDCLTTDQHRIYVSGVYSFSAAASVVMREIERVAVSAGWSKGK